MAFKEHVHLIELVHLPAGENPFRNIIEKVVKPIYIFGHFSPINFTKYK